MEFAGGGDAGKLFDSYNLNDDLVRLFIAETVIALDYIHKHNIYHKDIKPGNILISNDV